MSVATGSAEQPAARAVPDDPSTSGTRSRPSSSPDHVPMEFHGHGRPTIRTHVRGDDRAAGRGVRTTPRARPRRRRRDPLDLHEAPRMDRADPPQPGHRRAGGRRHDVELPPGRRPGQRVRHLHRRLGARQRPQHQPVGLRRRPGGRLVPGRRHCLAGPLPQEPVRLRGPHPADPADIGPAPPGRRPPARPHSDRHGPGPGRHHRVARLRVAPLGPPALPSPRRPRPLQHARGHGCGSPSACSPRTPSTSSCSRPGTFPSLPSPTRSSTATSTGTGGDTASACWCGGWLTWGLGLALAELYYRLWPTKLESDLDRRR